MLYILLVIGVALIIWGCILNNSYNDGDGIIILGATAGVPSLIAILIAGGVYNYDYATIDSRLAVLEEQNTTVLIQVEPLV